MRAAATADPAKKLMRTDEGQWANDFLHHGSAARRPSSARTRPSSPAGAFLSGRLRRTRWIAASSFSGSLVFMLVLICKCLQGLAAGEDLRQRRPGPQDVG